MIGSYIRTLLVRLSVLHQSLLDITHLFLPLIHSTDDPSLGPLTPSLPLITTLQYFYLAFPPHLFSNNHPQPRDMVAAQAPAVQAPRAKEPLDNLDPKRLADVQYLSGFCPFSLNSKPCPHGTKCTLKRLCYVRIAPSPHFPSRTLTIPTGSLRLPLQPQTL